MRRKFCASTARRAPRTTSTTHFLTKMCKSASRRRSLPPETRRPKTAIERGRSDFAWTDIVENAERLLRVFRHFRHSQIAAHECNPGFFGRRLKLREIPELALIHLDFGDFVVEYPIAQRGQPRLLLVAEHRLRQDFSHRRHS